MATTISSSLATPAISEESSVPRLTIIVPHRRSDERLESTLVSVLENRPDDSELIVVHDGSYADDYQISDEARLLASEPGASTTQLLNAGVRAAQAPVVAVVLDGVHVLPGWANDVDSVLADEAVACVAVNSADQNRRGGITPVTRANAKLVLQGNVDASLGSVQYAGPSIACGFYQRNTLVELGGWNERMDIASADVELAWMMQSVGVACESLPGGRYTAGGSVRGHTTGAIRQLAELCVAYGVTGSGYMAALTGWITAATSGQLKQASAWSSGMLGGTFTRSIIARLKLAQKSADELASQAVLPFNDASGSQSDSQRWQRAA
ncbi:MAG: hypothetical protein Aurels2KO_15910 [Aureliella sp.]